MCWWIFINNQKEKSIFVNILMMILIIKRGVTVTNIDNSNYLSIDNRWSMFVCNNIHSYYKHKYNRPFWLEYQDGTCLMVVNCHT